MSGLPGPVREVLEGALRGAGGGEFPGQVPRLDAGVFHDVDPSDLRPALTRILLGDLPDMGLVYLHGSGLLASVLPEVVAMIDFEDEYARHKDLWSHTIRVVAQVEPTPVLRWAALLHDIGKVVTRSMDDRGRIHFFGHEVVGERMFRKIHKRLRFEDDAYGRIRFLIRNHLRAGQYEPGWTDAAVRRFGKEMGDALDDLLALSRADITTKYESRKHRNHMLLEELHRRIVTIREQDAIPPALPKGLGNLLMERFGLEPGPRLGRIMGLLKDEVEQGRLPRMGEPSVYLRWIEEHPGLTVDLHREVD